MTPDAFRLLRQSEDSWWYAGRREIVRRALTVVKRKPLTLLDFGAGFGGMHDLLASYGRVVAYEPNRDAQQECHARGYETVIKDEAELRSDGGRFDVVGAFDVIEHIKEADSALELIRSKLAPEGLFVSTVPSFEWLWSEHDIAHQHQKRYTTATYRSLLERHGFRVLYLGYWNVFLFLPFVVARLFGESGERGLRLPRVLNQALKGIVRFEARWVPELTYPFGSSVICVATKT